MNFLPYWCLMRMHKPIGIFLLLWPTLWALWIAAQGLPSWPILFVFVMGTVLMRAAGCVINDIADRQYDKYVTRTQDRPLASGEISTLSAFILFTLLGLVAFVLVLTLNRFTIFLSFIGMALTVTYPLMKRWIHAPQLYLGFTFAWGIPMAFAAVQNHIPLIAWWLYAADIIWIIAYDTMYAMADREDDIHLNIYSTALLFGHYDRLIIAILQGILVALLIVIAIVLHLTLLFYLALSVTAGCFVYQHQLIAKRQPQRCLQAFLHNNWVGLIIFLGLLVG